MKKFTHILLMVFPGFSLASVSDGPYLGVEIGAANQIVNFTPSTFNLNTNGSNLSNSSVGFLTRLNFGYNLSRYSGFELGVSYSFPAVHNYPNNEGSLNSTLTNLDMSYLLYLPTLIDKWSVFGRVGVAYDWIGSGSGCGCNSTVSNPSGSSLADVLGAGLMYRITPNASF